MRPRKEADCLSLWCPDARNLTAQVVGVSIANRIVANGVMDTSCRCIGSGCMAWEFSAVQQSGVSGDQRLGVCLRYAGKPPGNSSNMKAARK